MEEGGGKSNGSGRKNAGRDSSSGAYKWLYWLGACVIIGLVIWISIDMPWINHGPKGDEVTDKDTEEIAVGDLERSMGINTPEGDSSLQEQLPEITQDETYPEIIAQEEDSLDFKPYDHR